MTKCLMKYIYAHQRVDLTKQSYTFTYQMHSFWISSSFILFGNGSTIQEMVYHNTENTLTLSIENSSVIAEGVIIEADKVSLILMVFSWLHQIKDINHY